MFEFEPGRAAEHDIDRMLALRRDDRLGRHRATEPVGGGEARGEQGLAVGDQLMELVGGQRAFELLEIDVVVDGLLGPRNHVTGRGGPADQQCHTKCRRA